MKFITKLSDAVYSIERILAIVLLSFMVTVIILGVVFRYFLNSPLIWSDEYALFTLVWITFIGGSMSIKTKKAAAVTLLMERIPRRISKPLVGLGSLLMLVFCLFILYFAMKWITNPAILLQKSPADGLPMLIPYVAIPLGFLFISIHSLDLAISVFRKQQGESV